MQPQPPIQKRGSLVSRQNRYSASRNTALPPRSQQPVQQSEYRYTTSPLDCVSPVIYENYTSPSYQQQAPAESPQDVYYTSFDENEEKVEEELSPEQIEHLLADQDRSEMMEHPDDEREFQGGKKLYDRQLMQQPMYDEPTMQILNDIAADESFPILVQYITQLSHLGRQAQARLIARAAAFQSKNQVFSNINNQTDYMMAQDDYTYAAILSKADFSTYDTNADYFTAEAIMEAQFNIRLRRSRNALNLLQINTQRQESIMGGQPQAEEERKLSRKLPFLGNFMG